MSDARTDAQRRPQAAGKASRQRTQRKPAFDKEHATLWLLTVTLGLGAGALFRFVERSHTTPPTSQLAVQQSYPPAGYGSGQSASNPYLNQRVTVLPQRTYGARGTTRMS